MRKSAAQCISDFSSQIGITINDISTPILYNYLVELYNEAYTQFDGSGSQLPILKTQSNFPNIYPIYSGSGGNDEAAFHSMIGWMFACQLAELKPSSRNTIFTKGYEFGGYKTSNGTNLYGYTFNYDPIVNRIVGGFIYVAMRGLKKPNIENMRAEVYGSRYGLTLNDCYWQTDSETESGLNAFYIDLREFLPSAPGPYASDYSNRQNLQNTIADNLHDNTFKIPEVDYQIYNEAFTNYRLDNPTYKAATIQAIADNDAELTHIFGADNKGTYDGVTIKAVFGPSVIGDTINPSSNKAQFLNLCMLISSAARDSLLSKQLSPPQYGRCRPGNSWTTGRIPANSSSNGDNSGRSGGSDYYNISVNAQIDDWDGHPTGYYDQNGNWITGGTYSSPEDYESSQKSRLDPTSYPSGHSSGITGIGMALSEIYPNKTDKILKAVNQFAVNRTIIKYHWNSDTLIGRLIGTAGNAIAHAASDYDNLLSGNSNPGGNDNPGGNEGGESIPLDTERPAMIISPNSGDLVTVSMASSITDDDLEIDIDWGGVGSSSTIRWKRDIIDTINYLIKPIKDLNIDGLSYNLLTSYSYFHNDICYDLKWLWAYYELLRTNYELLLEYKEDVEDWEENEYDPFVEDFNEFSTDYTNALAALNNGGPYYVFDHMSTPEYYSQAEADAYNYQLPGARHTTDIKSQTEEPDEPPTPSTYSLSFTLSHISMSWVSGQKASYNSGDSVTIQLTPDSQYTLPTSSGDIICSGATINGYNSSTGMLSITINSNASVIINGVSQGGQTETYSLAFTLNNVSLTYISNQKALYDDGDIVVVQLTPDSQYTLPTSSGDIICSGATINSYNSSTGILSIRINGNASVTINGVPQGEQPEIPAAIVFTTATEAYTQSISSSYTITRQTPIVTYPNNDNSSNYTIYYSVDDISIVEFNIDCTGLKVNGYGQAYITATMIKNSDNSIVTTGQYSIVITEPIVEESYKIIVNVKNSLGATGAEANYKIFVNSITFNTSSGNLVTFLVLNNSSQGIDPGGNRNISKDPNGHDIEYSSSYIDSITSSSSIYITANYGTTLSNSYTRTFSCVFQMGHSAVNKTTSGGVTTATMYIKVVDPNNQNYSTINNIISDGDNINDNKNINIDELNQAFISEKSNSKSEINNINNADIIYGATIIVYYTIEECNAYNATLPGAIHAGDIKVPSYAIYVEATLPTFPTLPSLPGPFPQISEDFDEDLEPIEYFTYTWDKGISTYNMPYEYVNMTDYISYTPNIQNTWQTLSYSMLKWKNNQVDDHPALLYEFIDFDD